MSTEVPETHALLITAGLGRGGVELNNVLQVLQTYIRDGIQIDVCSKGDTNGPCRKLYEREGSKVLHVPAGRIGLLYLWRLMRVLREGNYTAVLDFTGDFAGMSLLAGKIAGCKSRITYYVSTRRTFRPTLLRRCVVWIFHRMVKKYATMILSNSQAAIEAFFPTRDASDQRYAVVRNGLDADLYRPPSNEERLDVRCELGIPKETLVLGTVGGLRREKNQSLFIDMVSRLRKKIDNLHGLIVGEGPIREELESQVEQLGLGDCMHMVGVRTDVPRMLAAMDVFFLPSHFEGMPNALVEAEAAGLAVVANDRPEIREIIPEENLPKACVNIELPDRVEERLAEYLANAELRGRHGGIARKFVKDNFDLQTKVNEFVDILQGK